MLSVRIKLWALNYYKKKMFKEITQGKQKVQNAFIKKRKKKKRTSISILRRIIQTK